MQTPSDVFTYRVHFLRAIPVEEPGLPGPAFTAKFRLDPLDGGPKDTYEGRATGQQFATRCDKMIAHHGVTIQVNRRLITDGTFWQETVVQTALDLCD